MAIPHLALPLRLDGSGRFATNEQDSTEDVASCVAVVIGTPEGSRVEVPDFGCPRTEFAGPSPDDIVAAVDDWEPRADLSVEVVEGLDMDGSTTEVIALIRPHV